MCFIIQWLILRLEPPSSHQWEEEALVCGEKTDWGVCGGCVWGAVESESDLERGNSTCGLHHRSTRKNSTLALLMSRSEDKEKRSAGRDGRTARRHHPRMTPSDQLVFQSRDDALKLTLQVFAAYVRDKVCGVAVKIGWSFIQRREKWGPLRSGGKEIFCNWLQRSTKVPGLKGREQTQ